MKGTSVDEIVAGIEEQMLPVSEVVDYLQEAGYGCNFELVNGLLFCVQTGIFYDVGDLSVDEIYRFEDSSNALGIYFIYALHDRWSDVRGLFGCESAFGKPADP